MITEKFKPQPVIQNERVLGVYTQNNPGPTIICICAMHGNEPSGVVAFQEIFNKLKGSKLSFKGSLYGLMGNIKALNSNQRYLDKDLNRVWTSSNIKEIKKGNIPEGFAEADELYELYMQLECIKNESSGEIIVIDLHTTSSNSIPYVSINDTLRNRLFSKKFPLPTVLGLEEHLEGTILNYINDLGYIALGFEAGQHQDPNAITIHKTILALTLFYAGCIPAEGTEIWAGLSEKMYYEKTVYEIRHRHGITSGQGFKMLDGFENFDEISKGEKLAKDLRGVIYAKENGHIFMPLYQKLGNDGFFIIREIKWFWLNLSAVLRKTRFHRLLHLLPGINQHNNLAHTLVINTKIARWYVIDFFHLMGFRQKRKEGKFMVFTKREHDISMPKKPKEDN